VNVSYFVASTKMVLSDEEILPTFARF